MHKNNNYKKKLINRNTYAGSISQKFCACICVYI